MSTGRGTTDNFVLAQRPRLFTDRSLVLERKSAGPINKPQQRLVMTETVSPRVEPKPATVAPTLSAQKSRKPGLSTDKRVDRSYVLKREIVASSKVAHAPSAKPKKRSSSVKANAMMALAVLLLAFG